MGTFSTTIQDDYKVVDDAQTITYVATRESGTETYTVEYASGADYTPQEVVASQGFLNSTDRKWMLGRTEFPDGFKPQAGDKITDAGGNDYYLSGKLIALDSFRLSWELHTTEGQGQT